MDRVMVAIGPLRSAAGEMAEQGRLFGARPRRRSKSRPTSCRSRSTIRPTCPWFANCCPMRQRGELRVSRTSWTDRQPPPSIESATSTRNSVSVLSPSTCRTARRGTRLRPSRLPSVDVRRAERRWEAGSVNPFGNQTHYAAIYLQNGDGNEVCLCTRCLDHVNV